MILLQTPKTSKEPSYITVHNRVNTTTIQTPSNSLDGVKRCSLSQRLYNIQEAGAIGVIYSDGGLGDSAYYLQSEYVDLSGLYIHGVTFSMAADYESKFIDILANNSSVVTATIRPGKSFRMHFSL